ncbi:glycosyltransferase family 4 protein [Nodosilinea sp. E11]|uniref:glycosyltransferase family 4 protein n=1 Tax=Nodosilinea sp. E11 TaxID=3037479 RepID=UPI0029341E61|nr:glycosyltransferase family 4 protein [Nodosilinea sp. E11]WOD37004.1 glycosyltransferase family 4 protein [Nodosilinea sp. E11]
MHIAYICADPGIPVFGQKGCSIHVQEVIRAFQQQGATVELFAVRWGDQTPADLAGVKVHRLPPIPKGEAGLREQVALTINPDLQVELELSGPFDLIYERYSLWSYSAMEFAQTAGIPGILEVNAPLIEEQAEHRGLVHREQAERVAECVFRAAQGIVAVSKEVKGYLSRWGMADKVQVIPNGVNHQRFTTDLEPAIPKGSDAFTIGFIGSLKPWHGLSHLVNAFAKLHQRVPQARLLIVGDGPQRDTLQTDLEQRGLLPFAHLTGAVSPEQIPAFLASMDVGVAPYPTHLDFYFSPLKVVEYMAAGLPVVVSDIGQLSHLVTHRHTGWLCPSGDEGALAAALEELWQSPELRQQLGQAGQQHILAHHTWEKVAQQILAMAFGQGSPEHQNQIPEPEQAPLGRGRGGCAQSLQPTPPSGHPSTKGMVYQENVKR